MKAIRKCVFSGTFDPVTLGHVDIIERALGIFDEVHVLIAQNPGKKCRYDGEKRLAMLNAATARFTEDDKKVVCAVWERPIFEYCLKENISHMIKGVRNSSDFDYEKILALQTKSLCPHIETVLLYSKAEYDHISSTYVKGLVAYGLDVANAVPEEIKDLL